MSKTSLPRHLNPFAEYDIPAAMEPRGTGRKLGWHCKACEDTSALQYKTTLERAESAQYHHLYECQA